MDGLNVVVPFKDPAYYILRPSIAVADPAAGEDKAIDLDGFYGLHPALAPAQEHLRQKTSGNHPRGGFAGQYALPF